MNFGDDDIVIFSTGEKYFGDEVSQSMVIVGAVTAVLEPDHEEYWDYFWDMID